MIFPEHCIKTFLVVIQRKGSASSGGIILVLMGLHRPSSGSSPLMNSIASVSLAKISWINSTAQFLVVNAEVTKRLSRLTGLKMELLHA